jgi:hypothetical protein
VSIAVVGSDEMEWTHCLTEGDGEVTVVAEQEGPASLLRLESDEDAGSLEDGVGTNEHLLFARGRESDVVVTDVLNLERRGPGRWMRQRGARRGQWVRLTTSLGSQGRRGQVEARYQRAGIPASVADQVREASRPCCRARGIGRLDPSRS